MSRTLANATAKDRPPTDFYQTPDAVTLALMGWLSLNRADVIWEPACGDGMMQRVLERSGNRVIGTDLSSGKDFLSTERTADWIITNPPFSRATEFIERAHAVRPRKGIALLLKSQFWHALRRNELFYRLRPAAVLPLSWRPDFLFGAKSGAPTMEVLWTVWRMSPHNPSLTIYEPLARPSETGGWE